MPDWLFKLSESSPYWGPFLVALAMILYFGANSFQTVVTVFSNGLSDTIKRNTAALEAVQTTSVNSLLVTSKLAEAVDRLSEKVTGMPTSIPIPPVVVNVPNAK